jgi:hypothetical protein
MYIYIGHQHYCENLNRHKGSTLIQQLIEMHFFSTARQPLVDQGILSGETSWSHSDTPHLVGLLWTSEQPDAEALTWQHTTHTKQTYMPPVEFEPAIPATNALDRAAIEIGWNAFNLYLTMLLEAQFTKTWKTGWVAKSELERMWLEAVGA